MKRPTVLQLEGTLRATAFDLLVASRCMMERYVGLPAGSFSGSAPVWSLWAEQGFAALETLGVPPLGHRIARELTPWVGAL